MEYWTAFIIGLVGSLHCAGMCGPLALALPATGNSSLRFFAGRVGYNAGRILTYCLLGLLFGLFGRTLVFIGVQRWISITLGVLLIVGLFTSRRLVRWLPITVAVNWLKGQMSGVLRQRSLRSLVVLGLLNGFLPCGLVYVACAAATTTGSIVGGVVYMAAFGAGTAPMMLAIGLAGRLIPISVRLRLRAAVPVAVFLVGALLVLRGMELGIPHLSPNFSQQGAACCRK